MAWARDDVGIVPLSTIEAMGLFCFGLGKGATNIWIMVLLDETDEVVYCICGDQNARGEREW